MLLLDLWVLVVSIVDSGTRYFTVSFFKKSLLAFIFLLKDIRVLVSNVGTVPSF